MCYHGVGIFKCERTAITAAQKTGAIEVGQFGASAHCVVMHSFYLSDGYFLNLHGKCMATGGELNLVSIHPSYNLLVA